MLRRKDELITQHFETFMHSFKTESGFPLLYDWLSTKYGLAALEKGSHEYDYNFGHLESHRALKSNKKSAKKKLPLFLA